MQTISRERHLLGEYTFKGEGGLAPEKEPPIIYFCRR